MAVYVDELIRCAGVGNWRYGKSCHLFADTVDELHALADSIGLMRSWFQDTSHPHYDLTTGKRKMAVEHGAIEITAREYLKMRR